MTAEEMKVMQEAISKEISAFKSQLGNFVDADGMKKAMADFGESLKSKFDDLATSKALEDLEKSVIAQGEILASMKLASGEKTVSFKETYTKRVAEIAENISKGINTTIFTTRKDVMSTSVVDGTLGYREVGVGQIPRGVPYLRDLMQVVNVGSNTMNTVRWWEQTSVVNNAKTTPEDRVMGDQSNMTWVERNLTGKRLVDWAKVGVDEIKDVDFILGEMQNLTNRNMRLKENSALLNGDGTGNNMAGILSYAKEFVSSGVQIAHPNINDVSGKIITQIENDMLGLAMPNYVIANRSDVDDVRFAKTVDGVYLFPQYLSGGVQSLGGITLIENPIVPANTLLAGDFSLATLYVWDDLVIEIAQIHDDKETGKVTILAYMRENLRVKDCEKNGFVKVSDIDATLALIDSASIVQEA